MTYVVGRDSLCRSQIYFCFSRKKKAEARLLGLQIVLSFNLRGFQRMRQLKESCNLLKGTNLITSGQKGGIFVQLSPQ